jgi:hypothetical protein
MDFENKLILKKSSYFENIHVGKKHIMQKKQKKK